MDVADRPQFTASEAIEIAAAHFAWIAAQAEALPSERDQNFRLTDIPGRRCVLKIAHPAETVENLDFQNQALLHLHRNATPTLYPEVIPGRSGDGIVCLLRDGRRFLIRLLTYLPGTPLSEVRTQPVGLLRSIGRNLAATDAALLRFEHPAMDRHLYWDSQHALATIGWDLDFLASPVEREIVSHFLNRFEEQAVPQLSRLRRSVVHNDANDYNILISEAGSGPRMTGLIDFGDLVRTCTICELANCCAYVLLSQPDPEAALPPLIGAYDERFPLTRIELDLLADFIAIRLCLSVTNSARQKRRAPDNEYLVISERPAWALLQRWSGWARPDLQSLCMPRGGNRRPLRPGDRNHAE